MVTHRLILRLATEPGELAQLARAPALHAGGHRFDSDILHDECLKKRNRKEQNGKSLLFKVLRMRFFSRILKIEVRGTTALGVTPRAEDFGQSSLTYWDNDIVNIRNKLTFI